LGLSDKFPIETYKIWYVEVVSPTNPRKKAMKAFSRTRMCPAKVKKTQTENKKAPLFVVVPFIAYLFIITWEQ